MSNLITISNVRGFIDETGIAQLNAEDIARGFGFVQIKNGSEYVRWGTVNDYLMQFGYSQQVGKDNFIPENMVYRLGFKASNETAQKFQAKLADEILPAIRKHGAYMTPATLEKALLNPDFIIQLAQKLKTEQEQNKLLSVKIEQDKPKVLFADSVAASTNSILVGEMAKILNQNGVDIGQNRFFEWLRENGYLIKRKGTDYNMPTQYSAELKLFEIKETSIVHGDGHITINKTPKLTGKGQIYFVNKFKDCYNF